jgi:hypothetical protein
MARRSNPYPVIPVRHPYIVDFKKVHKDHYRNVTCDIKNNKIIWNKVKHIQLRKEKPGSMFVKYDFSEEFMEIECTPKIRGKPKKLKTFSEFPQKYNRRLAISIAKKKTLYHYANQNVNQI